MYGTAFATIITNEMLDKTVSLVCKEYPAFWIIPLVGVLVFGIRQVVDYNAKRHPNKIQTHDRLDSETFSNAVVPLLVQLNDELKDTAIQSINSEEDDSIDATIEKYEKAKIDAISTIDLSSLESAMNITDALKRVAVQKKLIRTYDNCYNIARTILVLGILSYSLNIIIGLALLFSFGVLNLTDLSRNLFILWLILAVFNILVAAVYIVCQIIIDGINYE